MAVVTGPPAAAVIAPHPAAQPAASYPLAGPPELGAVPALPPRSYVSALTGDPFLDMLHFTGGQDMTRTENGSWTHATSLSPCLDFFFQVVPDTGKGRVQALLGEAWSEDSLTALKLVMQLRGVRGTGKADKAGFYHAATWLYQHHPRTLCANVARIAQFGYWKDLLELTLRAAEGGAVTDARLAEQQLYKEHHKEGEKWVVAKKKVWKELAKRRKLTSPGAEIAVLGPNSLPGPEKTPSARREAKRLAKAARLLAKRRKLNSPGAEIAVLGPNSLPGPEKTPSARREAKRLAKAARLLKAYESQVHFRALHEAVADAFAAQLKQDLEALRAGKKRISLAAKWTPSLNSSYDDATLLCEAIARRLFPRELYPEDLEDAHYAYRVRDRLRKEVLVPLRSFQKLPEIFMSANKWEELPYNRVPSVCMRLNKKHFLRHDEARFTAFLEQAKRGERRLASGALLPHLVLKDALEEGGEGGAADVAELQWQSMVADLKGRGALSSSLAVCDVSGSMSGLPLDVCVALGLLLADISEAPWNGSVCTFSATPRIHRIRGDTLLERAQYIREMDWGVNTNFQAVFDRILSRARQCGLPPASMVKRLYVFSDMEFDQASACPFQTDYLEIQRKFREARYPVPEIVFWNLRDSASCPVIGSQPGVALVSGFSKNILKLFLEQGGVPNPLEIMKRAISGPAFEALRVVD